MFRFNFNNDANTELTQESIKKKDIDEDVVKESEEICINDEKYKEICQNLKTSSVQLNTFISK